jgi:hypothetical protein
MGWQEGTPIPTAKSIAASRFISVLGWGASGVGVVTFVRGLMGICRRQ